jgi:putative ABC transport system permease protein
MLILQLAIRNLTRNLRRTLLSMGSIIAGVALLIIGQAFIGGLDENLIRAQVDALTGHVHLRPNEYPSSPMQQPIDHLFAFDPALVTPIEAAGGVWTTRLQFNPTLVFGGDAMRLRAIAIDPQRDPSVFPRDTWHVTGECTSAEQIGGGVLLSQGVAETLKLFVDPEHPDQRVPFRPGVAVVLKARTVDGAINALSMPVCGVFTTGNMAIDKFGAFVTLAFAKELLLTDRVSHAVVRLPSRYQAAALREDLDKTLATGGLGERIGKPTTSTWVEDTFDLLQMQQIRRRALNLLVFVLLGMSALGILNTILMAAYERVREVGTLRAMGMTRGGVVRLFLLEGAMMGVAGGLPGAGLGGSVTLWYASHGIDLTASLKVGGTIPISTMLYVEHSNAIIAMAVAFAIVTAAAASIYPALVASRMQPADAVRAD